jgi:branched-subunit amino acid aminotransferase/4-amino-4-deoxychorismate lyase
MSAPTGCYTTARVVRGEVRHLERHVARLARDARALGLGVPPEESLRRALIEHAGRSFPDHDGVIRLELRAAGDGGPPGLVATARGLGAEPACWRAVVAKTTHPGSSPWSACKTTERSCYEGALDEARVAGVDEALLADADGQLVEGARTNLFVVGADGVLRTPPLARGAQAGIARTILLERIPELAEADVAVADLAASRELVVGNAVRGARAVVTVDGRAVGDGRPGPWSARLDATLDAN